jgi:hypothetical protein
MNMKRALVFFALATGLAAITQTIGYVDYLMNRAFILANIETLPFRYSVALGFGSWQWWTFVISIVTGVIGAFAILFGVDENQV